MRPAKALAPPALSFLWRSIGLGVLATAILDLWNLARALAFDVAFPRYDLIGRWLLHMLDGRFVHDSIRAADPRTGELFAGWGGHYAIGVVFAMMLLGVWGLKWLHRPRIIPAMLVGLATVAIPYLLMQPGMGSGVAGRLSADPDAARMKVVVSHVVFGAGLYLAGWLMAAGSHLRSSDHRARRRRDR